MLSTPTAVAVCLPARIDGPGATPGEGGMACTSQPSPCRTRHPEGMGRSQPRLRVPCGPGRPESNAQDLCVQAHPPLRRCARRERRGCASAPHVVFAGVYGPDPRYCRCANHLVEDSRESADEAVGLFMINIRLRACGLAQPVAHRDGRHPGHGDRHRSPRRRLPRTQGSRERDRPPGSRARTGGLGRVRARPDRHAGKAGPAGTGDEPRGQAEAAAGKVTEPERRGSAGAPARRLRDCTRKPPALRPRP